MTLLSAVHALVFLVYVLLGLFVVRRDYRSRVNWSFLALCAGFAWWALCAAFGHDSADPAGYMRWMAWSRPASSLVPALLLHFFLILTERRKAGVPRRLAYGLAYVPALVFLVRGLHGPLFVVGVEPTPLGWIELQDQSTPWFWAFTAYYAVYASAAFLLARRWGARSASELSRRQSRVIVAYGAATLALILLAQAIVPAAAPHWLPSLTPALILVWISGIFWAITRHGFLALSPTVAANDIVETMSDALLLLGPRGDVRAVNGAVQRLFGWTPQELVGRSWRLLTDPRRSPELERIVALFRKGAIDRYETSGLRKDGSTIPLVASTARVGAGTGQEEGSIVVLRDDSARRKAEEWIHHLAHHDVLTDLPNRLLFQDRLQQALYRAHRYKHQVGVLVLDIDRLKEVNDSLGHDAGDRLLRSAAERLRRCVSRDDTAARLGGDEFAVALGELAAPDEAESVARRILEVFGEPFDLGGREVRSSVSIGLAIHPDHGEDPDTLLRNADLAMYRAKQSGRNRYRAFEHEPGRGSDRGAVERRLRRAVEERQLLLHYQPQVELASGRIIGVEALLRWHDPERGLVPPLEFLPLAEETGLIVPIGAWVLRTACAQAAAWRAAGLPSVPVSVNISGRQLARDDFCALVAETLAKVGLPPGDLELEVTEQATRRDAHHALETLRRLRELGVRIALDDLGAGQTSLAFLARIPWHTLKIAQTFVRELPGRPESRVVVEGILALARELGLARVVAEGVETSAQLDDLRGLGCPVVQGYATGRPAGAHETAVRLAGGDISEISTVTGRRSRPAEGGGRP
jgi:diguanylate cyclase (GGDEF)-like protein/PAS domain S-box-containing protein